MDYPTTHVNCIYCLTPNGAVRGVKFSGKDQQTFTFVCDACKRSWQGDPHHAPDPSVWGPLEDATNVDPWAS